MSVCQFFSCDFRLLEFELCEFLVYFEYELFFYMYGLQVLSHMQ